MIRLMGIQSKKYSGALLALFFFSSVLLLHGSESHAAEDPVVGKWDGVGFQNTFHAVFEKDRTYRLSDDWQDKNKGEFISGTWSVQNGKYALHAKDDNRTGEIDAQGQLIIGFEEDQHFKMYFRRQGAKPVIIPAGEPPKGEWRYAYTSSSGMPANPPFPFDVLVFSEKGKIRLKCSSVAKELSLNCSFKGNVISIAEGDPATPLLEFSYRWANGGKTLLLSIPSQQHGPFDLEWAYLRPDQFLPYDIQGMWVGNMSRELNEMTEEVQMDKNGCFSRTVFTKDGQPVHKNNQKVTDYYRLWKAPFGNALTVVTFNTEVGAQMTQMFKYEKKGNELILIPIELQEGSKLKVHQEEKLIWKLKKAK